MFMNEIARFKVLTREEENLLLCGLKEGKPDVINRLIEANLRFALKMVFRYWRPGYSLTGMVSGACLGLVVAGRTFNPDMGVRFTTYAFPAIRQGIVRAILGGAHDFCQSLDAAVYEDGASLKDGLASDESSPEEIAETIDMTRYLAVLTPKERQVIELRFWKDKTLEEIGRVLNVQKEWVRRIESRALIKLRLALRGRDIQWK